MNLQIAILFASIGALLFTQGCEKQEQKSGIPGPQSSASPTPAPSATPSPIASPAASTAIRAPAVPLQLSGINQMLMNHQFDEFERQLALQRQTNAEKRSYDSAGLEETYNRFQYKADLLPHLDEWCRLRQESHFAHVWRGLFYIDHAWAARGGGFAYTVSEQSSQLFQERLLAAKADLEKAYALDPGDANVPARLITVAMGLGLPREAMEDYFQKAIHSDPAIYDAYSRKLQYLMAKWHGSDNEMFAFARQCAANPPPRSRVGYILIAAHKEMAGSYKEGPSWWKREDVIKEIENVFTLSGKGNRDYSMGRNYAAYYALMAENYVLAQQILDKVGVNWRPGPWQSVFDFQQARIKCMIQQGKPVDGSKENAWFIEGCTKKIAEQPETGFYYYSRALCHRFASNFNDAIADLASALKTDPYNTEYLEELTRVYYFSNQLDKVLEQCQFLLSIEPWNTTALHKKCLVLLERCDYEQASQNLERALSVSPEWPNAWHLLSYCYLKLGRYEKSLEAADNVLASIQSSKRDLDHVPWAKTMRCIALLGLNRDKEAQQEAQKGMQEFPDEAGFYEASARIMLASSNPSLRNSAGALTEGEKAVEKSKRTDPDCLEALAMAYEANQMPNKAMETYEELLRLRPQYKPAKDRLNALGKK